LERRPGDPAPARRPAPFPRATAPRRRRDRRGDLIKETGQMGQLGFIQAFDPLPVLNSVISLLAAFILGTLIGVERQFRQRSAGLRTNTLVAIGAAAFVDLGQRLGGDVEAVRVVSYVVSGVGFLGAGVIMKDGMNIRGINTAATLWCSAAVGACAGTDMVAEAVLVTLFVLCANTLLHPLVDWINRAPVNVESGEAKFEVMVTTDAAVLPRVRRRMIEQLTLAQYPVSNVEVIPRGGERVEIVALLVPTAVVASELDAAVAEIATLSGVSDAIWEQSALE
jgi:putative Mg2+ transporter-C (MgtC) family protein